MKKRYKFEVDCANCAAKVEAAEDAAFNATVSLTNWNNEAGYKLIDLIVTVPEGLRVTGVTPGSRLSGGELNYNLEADTGKLRIVYFDANENSNLTISGTEYPAEVLTIGFALENVAAGSTLPIAISGMSIKLFSDSTDENAMIIVDTADASGSVEVVQGISFSAVTLYTGDDVDLIPSTKKAVAVSVTGISKGAKIQYNDGPYSAVTSKSQRKSIYWWTSRRIPSVSCLFPVPRKTRLDFPRCYPFTQAKSGML